MTVVGSGIALVLRDLISVLTAAFKLLRKSLSLYLAEESFPLAYCQTHPPSLKLTYAKDAPMWT